MSGVYFAKKTETWWCRAVAAFIPAFNEHFWTTLGNTIYVPARYDDDVDWGSLRWRARHAQNTVIAHELVHVAQFERFGIPLMLLFILGPSPFLLLAAVPVLLLWKTAGMMLLAAVAVLSPLSLGLAYGRWWVERSAYLVSIQQGADVEQVVDTLWWDYGFCWPRAWMRAWFTRHSASVSGRSVITR